MLNITAAEVFIIGLMVLVLFGNRLPRAMRSLGRSMSQFKNGITSAEHDAATTSELASRPD